MGITLSRIATVEKIILHLYHFTKKIITNKYTVVDSVDPDTSLSLSRPLLDML